MEDKRDTQDMKNENLYKASGQGTSALIGRESMSMSHDQKEIHIFPLSGTQRRQVNNNYKKRRGTKGYYNLRSTWLCVPTVSTWVARAIP